MNDVLPTLDTLPSTRPTCACSLQTLRNNGGALTRSRCCYRRGTAAGPGTRGEQRAAAAPQREPFHPRVPAGDAAPVAGAGTRPGHAALGARPPLGYAVAAKPRPAPGADHGRALRADPQRRAAPAPASRADGAAFELVERLDLGDVREFMACTIPRHGRARGRGGARPVADVDRRRPAVRRAALARPHRAPAARAAALRRAAARAAPCPLRCWPRRA